MLWWTRKQRRAAPLTAAQRRIVIPENVYRRMINHCYEERPLEACGLLVGEAGHVAAGYATDNQERSPILYRVDDRQLLAAAEEAHQQGREIVAIYHSHVASEPIPSRTDIAQATWPEAFYIIISLKGRRPRARAWRIVDGQVSEHLIVVARHFDGEWYDLRKAVRTVGG
ncbi:Mov34/MPN/PAD-1 family protein [Symbiobacterium terraclitae]|uniref:Mov34/MPN/PAD-1 family protein n=1 Tax=Symbiobacterium terraclitae TaxID=557451 RepID=UPI0035B4FD01